jgi:hypothetical protein
MKYIANPVIVEAFEILEVHDGDRQDMDKTPEYRLVIGGPKSSERNVIATSEMTSRMTPKVGDYWVIQADGYVYLNPKEVFERKYHKA